MMTETHTSQHLSDRELDVLCLLVKGYGNGEIATDLHLSVRTVAGHISNLKQKLNVDRRADLIRYVRQNGLGC
jgi:DNA-binding NarL/FixJ family response regulator